MLPAVFFSGTGNAGEELAPGYDVCMEHALSDMDMMQCASEVCEHWDRGLNENYAAALKVCASVVAPEACRANVSKAERFWGQYKEAMFDALMELAGRGSLACLSSQSFLTEETRKQALLPGTAGR